jgi:hypothetical protein
MNKFLAVIGKHSFLKFALLMEFAGLLYEQLVFLPNFFTGQAANTATAFSEVFQSTNPALYHAFFSTLIFAHILVVRAKVETNKRSYVVPFCACVGLLLVSSGVAVTLLNPPLYFGTDAPSGLSIETLAQLWGVVNAIRLICLALCLWFISPRSIKIGN